MNVNPLTLLNLYPQSHQLSKWQLSHLGNFNLPSLKPFLNLISKVFTLENKRRAIPLTGMHSRQFKLNSRLLSTSALGSHKRPVIKPRKKSSAFAFHPARIWNSLFMLSIKTFRLKQKWKFKTNKHLLDENGYQLLEWVSAPVKKRLRVKMSSPSPLTSKSRLVSNALLNLVSNLGKNTDDGYSVKLLTAVQTSYKLRRRKFKRKSKANPYHHLIKKYKKLDFRLRFRAKPSTKLRKRFYFRINSLRRLGSKAPFYDFSTNFRPNQALQLTTQHSHAHPFNVNTRNRFLTSPLLKLIGPDKPAFGLRSYSKIKLKKKPRWLLRLFRNVGRVSQTHQKRRYIAWDLKVRSETPALLSFLKPRKLQSLRTSSNPLLLLKGHFLPASFPSKTLKTSFFRGYSLPPQALNPFTRSPFFFLNLLTLSPTKNLNLLQTTNGLQKRLRYVVFQTANSIKIHIFRKLMSRRRYSEFKVKPFSSRFGLVTKSKRDRVLLNKVNPLTPSRSLTGSANAITLFKGSLFWLRNRIAASKSYRSSFLPRIKRIRFKPGYGRIWRSARRTVQEILGISYRYQYRLTPKIQKAYWDHRATHKHLLPLTLEFVLMSTRLISDCWIVRDLVASGTVFLNGVSCLKTETNLFQSDLIQLVIHLKFYTVFKWLANVSLIKQRRLNKVFYRRIKAPTPNRPYRMEKSLPVWFFNLNSAFGDIPSCFEVDYFTLSTLVVYNERLHSAHLPWKSRYFNYLELNMYNWKYIT